MTATTADDDSGVVDWLVLVQGTTRERLIERLAQACLSGESRAPAETDSLLGELSDLGTLEDTRHRR
jgi:hypothetical protein